MKNLYNRVENLNEIIQSVKLPYLAWKILFLVNKKADSKEIAGLLETEEETVSDSIQLLIQSGLVVVDGDGSSDTVVEGTTHVDEQADQVIEAIEEKEVLEEPIQENEEDTEIIEAVKEEEQQKENDVLDELINESEEQGSKDVLDEQLEEAEPEPIEEEKIEINIPEEDDNSDETEFSFNLTGEEKTEDKVPEKPPVDESQGDSPDKSGYKKILVIDDSLVIRKMVEIALEEEEFIIETAVSGKDGLEVMDQTNPDLVILDMMLPDINGIEILKTIKASKGIPVIMLSGKDSPQMIETAKNEGAAEFLPKPFKDDELVEKIKKLI